MPQVDLIPENILIQHTQSICGKCLSCVCQTGNEWNGAVLFDLGKERSCILAKSQYSGARVLGFCKDAAPLLTEIKKNSSIPLITSLADARQTLPADALRMLNQDILRNQIYLGHLALKNKKEMVNEYRTPIVIV